METGRQERSDRGIETVLEEFWESKAEEEFDSLVELYGLA